jgi:hypothetical protein
VVLCPLLFLRDCAGNGRWSTRNCCAHRKEPGPYLVAPPPVTAWGGIDCSFGKS